MTNKSTASPVFLLKTYNLIETTPNDMVEWSADGTSFTVKRPKEFAEKILPRFFKHNNFSSFVRQLNFYGFRKQRRDACEDSGHVNINELQNWWEFRHESFVRGQKHLLATMRRRGAGDTASVDKQEVELLRKEIATLQSHVQVLNQQMLDMVNELTNYCGNTATPAPFEQAPLVRSAPPQYHYPTAKRQRVEVPEHRDHLAMKSYYPSSNTLAGTPSTYENSMPWDNESFYSTGDSTHSLPFAYPEPLTTFMQSI